MPPVLPPLKNDGPACRVCGCTEHNACVTHERRPHPSNPKGPATTLTAVSCSWVKTRGVDAGPLCSACAGTKQDLAEAMVRGRRAFWAIESDRVGASKLLAINNAVLGRYRAREKAKKRG